MFFDIWRIGRQVLWLRRVRQVFSIIIICVPMFATSLSYCAEPIRMQKMDLRQDLYALVIGVSNYNRGWPVLEGVQKDVDAVETRLKMSGFKTTVIMDPNLMQIDKAFADMSEIVKLRPAARLLIYYAGHGENLKGPDDKTDSVGYLVPVDAPPPSRDRKGFTDKSLRIDMVRDLFRQLPTRHAILLLDNCFSGSIFLGMRGSDPDPPSIRQMVSFRSRMILSAGTSKQKVPDDSIFRRYFEAALTGEADENQDGYITGTELASYIRYKVSNAPGSRQTPLFVKIGDDKDDNALIGEFVLLSPRGGKAPISDMLAEDHKKPPKRAAKPVKLIVAGEVFRDCEQSYCPNMTVLPPGTFMYGSAEAEEGRSILESRQEKIEMKGFAISQHEVTFDLWDACFKDGGCYRWPDDMGWGRGGRPVVNVTQKEAIDFTKWLSMKTGQSYRLPTEQEWEYAARGGQGKSRPWGDFLGRNRANCRDCESSWSGKSTSPVGSFLPNGFKLFDMMGNAWEWTAECRNEPAKSGLLSFLYKKREKESSCAIRGGSYSTAAKGIRSAARSLMPEDHAAKNIGFRVVRETVK